ncbi:MAG: RNA 2',3'-cyclic phosphodiesterase [archaeon]
MRIFIAVDLPKEVKDYLYNLKKEFKGGKITWVNKKNLHITINFIGSITEEKTKQIQDKIKTIKLPQFKVKLSKLGYFPSEKNIKVIWVDVEPESKVKNLAQKIDQELIEFSQQQEFKSHITLGRLKGFKKKEDFYKSLKEIKIKPIEFEINSFQLYQSILRKEGPVYKLIENVKMS